MSPTCKYILFCFCSLSNVRPFWAQLTKSPTANFSFNYGSDLDEVNHRHAKMVGNAYCEDRFGNPDHAVYLFGHEHSYINLGTDSTLKPKVGSISIWVKIQTEVYAGQGPMISPIIISKCTRREDFYEAYGICYGLMTKKIHAYCMRDSLNQPGVCSMNDFQLLTWHHLAITYDNDFFALYVDGNLAGKAIKNFETIFDPLDSVMVGVTASKKNNRATNTIVDDIQFYDTVLSAKEIRDLYTAPNPNRSKVILNRVLILLFILIVIAIFYLLIRFRFKLLLKKEKQRLELVNKQLENELRVNRALMNPHFIFNSLNTLHHYILSNKVDAASDYLVKFSQLVRKILESNMSDTISLELEIELIERYLDIEGMRFKEKIKYTLTVDPRLKPSAIIIPIMMLQPFIENSIWHGLRDKTGDKVITISLSPYETDYIRCIIEDNGTGRKKKEPNALEKKSMATGFVVQRLALLNKIHNLNGSLNIVDKPEGQGTIVTLILPILHK